MCPYACPVCTRAGTLHTHTPSPACVRPAEAQPVLGAGPAAVAAERREVCGRTRSLPALPPPSALRRPPRSPRSDPLPGCPSCIFPTRRSAPPDPPLRMAPHRGATLSTGCRNSQLRWAREVLLKSSHHPPPPPPNIWIRDGGTHGRGGSRAFFQGVNKSRARKWGPRGSSGHFFSRATGSHLRVNSEGGGGALGSPGLGPSRLGPPCSLCHPNLRGAWPPLPLPTRPGRCLPLHRWPRRQKPTLGKDNGSPKPLLSPLSLGK